MKKKSVIRLLSLSLCGVLAATSITMFAHADTTNTAAGDNTSTSEAAALQGLPLFDLNAGEEESYKDETVYVLSNADGSVSKVIVSDWLKNGLSETAIKDVTHLENIENVKGDETFVDQQDDTYWNAQGNDIYYQGTTNEALPVDVTVTYLLDGQRISPSELKGKSGHVTIRYEYKNHQTALTTVNGKEESMYVPFAILTGLMLDDETFTNVEVSGGRLINDGQRTIVAGVAFPGLQENLKLDKEKFDIPESLEIQADVTDFQLSGAVIVATNEIFNHFQLEGTNSLEELEDSVNQLSDAMDQLTDGSSRLTDGLLELLEKSGELKDGAERLSEGSEALKNGAAQLNDGAASLSGGLASLNSGLNTLASNNASLNGGARQVFDTLLSTARNQLTAAGLSVPEMTIENYAGVLNGVIASLDENAVYAQALQAVTDAVNAQADLIREKVTEAIRAEVLRNVTEAVCTSVTAQVIQNATGMDVESYQNAAAAGMIPEESQNAIAAAIDAQMNSEQVAQIIESTVEEKMASEEVQALIESTVAAQIQQAIDSNMASPEVQSQLAAASEGLKSVVALKASLDGYNAFYCGLQSYTAGVAQAAAGAGALATGAGELRDGTQKLYDGADQLANGLQTLKDSMPALIDGIQKLYNGSSELSDGLTTFNEKGIQKLVDAVDGDLEGLVMRLKATLDASRQYRNFSGISEDMEGQVKFIYRIAGIDD